MNGIELAQAIRSREGASGLPIVLLGFLPRSGDRIGIPVARRQQLSWSSRCRGPVCNGGSASHRFFAGPLLRRKPPTEIPASGPVAKVLVAEDNPTSQKVILLMLSKMGHQVDIVPDGRQRWKRFATRTTTLSLWIVRCPKWMASRRRV